MDVSILSAEQCLFRGRAESVTLPGVAGVFTVLKDHAPLIAALKAGTVYCRLPDGEELSPLSIEGGCVRVDDNRVIVCVE